MQCEEGGVVQPQQSEEEITFMVQVQRDDDEEQQTQDPEQHGQNCYQCNVIVQTPEGSKSIHAVGNEDINYFKLIVEEIIVEAVDLEEGEITPQVLATLPANKVVGMGSYQYGESEQPVRAVMKVRSCFRVKYNFIGSS